MADFIRRHISDFDHLITAERLTGGANQETYRLDCARAQGNGTFALRRAAGGATTQSSDENIGLDGEAQLMRIAAQHEVPVPVVRAELAPDDNLGAGFLMDWLDGETRGSRIARHGSFAKLRRTLAFECGRILAKIHAIDIQRNSLEELLPERTPESFVRDTWARYRALDTPQPMLDYAACWLLENLPRTSRRALVHNDFRNGNLMVDHEKIVAVLDWEVAHIGDPYRDLGWLSTGSWRFGGEHPVGGFGTREQLFAGYRAESGAEIVAADVQFWEVFGSFWWGVGCLLMAQQYRQGPDPSVERPGIGRRSSECQMDIANLIIPGTVEQIDSVQSEAFNLPSADELVASVGKFLREDVLRQTTGRVQFLARVAANSLDIARRESSLGPGLAAAEQQRLADLLASDGDLAALRWQLVNRIRAQEFDLNDERLQQHLRQSSYEALAVDQPNYHAFHTASQLK